jgi:hypothetical protein
MKIQDLNNEEVILMYTLIEDMLSEMNEIILNKGVKHIVDSPVGKVALFMELQDKTVEEMKNSKKYQLLTRSIKKLAPVVDIINDSYPNLSDEIHETIFSISLNDEGPEEDM